MAIGTSRVKRKAIKLYSSCSNLKSPVQAGKEAFKFLTDQMTQRKKKKTTTSTNPQSPQIIEEDERYKEHR